MQQITPVTTEFITVSIEQPLAAAHIPDAVEQALQPFGDILRWAVTAVDMERRLLQVEAVVLTIAPARNEPVADGSATH